MSNVLQKKSNTIIPIERKIPIETDGEWKVIIKAVDKAGNESGEKLVEVYKDTVPPRVDTPEISNITGRGFRITVSAGDTTSQVAKYEYYINGNKHGENDTGIYEVSGLKPNTSYTVSVKVYDNAGLSSLSNNKPTVTGLGLQAPTIDLSGTSQNGYYKGTITVNLAEREAGTGATKIKYKLNGVAEQQIAGTSGSFTIEQDGSYTIEAWTEDNDGNKSTSANANVTKDTTGPNVTLTPGTATSYNYTYEGLTGGKGYNLRVTVTDKAGNTGTGTNVANTKKPEKNPGGIINNITTDEELFVIPTTSTNTDLLYKKLDYTPVSKTITINSALTGASSNQTLQAKVDGDWIIIRQTDTHLYVLRIWSNP